MEKELDYIYGIPKFAGKATLDNTKAMIQRLGAECKKSRIVHVAGTNGKGSVCAYLDSILRRAGYSVGLFTSPHLVRINERIVLNGVQISDEEFEECFEKVRQTALSMLSDGLSHPSFFEFIFGMAMYYFSHRKPDYIILETGLGGRLDATNIFAKPQLTVITSISLDHTEILGDTYEAVAAEKAGIIKAGVPVVFFDKRDDVTRVIRKKAAEAGAPVYMLKPSDIRDITCKDKNIDFLLHNEYYCNERFTVSSSGIYQAENASIAAVGAAVLGICGTDAVKEGIASAFWAGRMQETSSKIVVDGAHNGDGIRSFIDSVRAEKDRAPQSGKNGRILIFSAVKDKHYREMITALCGSGLFDRFILTKINDKRGLDTKVMQSIFEECTADPVEIYATVREAYGAALRYMENGAKVYCAGSLYLAGEVLALDEKELL